MGGPIDIAQRRWQWVIHDHDHDHLVIKVRCMDLPDSDWGDFNCLCAVDSSSLIYHNFTCPGANFTYPAKFWVARADWSPIIFNSSPPPQCCIYESGQHWFIGSDNGLSPFSAPSHCLNQCWCSIEPLGTNFSEIWIKIQNFSFIKMQVKMLAVKWRPFCRGGDELNTV